MAPTWPVSTSCGGTVSVTLPPYRATTSWTGPPVTTGIATGTVPTFSCGVKLNSTMPGDCGIVTVSTASAAGTARALQASTVRAAATGRAGMTSERRHTMHLLRRLATAGLPPAQKTVWALQRVGMRSTPAVTGPNWKPPGSDPGEP